MSSKSFPISNGVKQSCVLAPSHFGIFLTAGIQEAYKDRDEGIYIHYCTDGKLFNIALLRANTKVPKELWSGNSCLQMIVKWLSLLTQNMICRLWLTALRVPQRNMDWTISLKKREVLYQPPPGAEHVDPVINLNGKALNSVQFFKYLGSTLSSSATIDDEINYRIIQANSSFGRLRSRVSDLRPRSKFMSLLSCLHCCMAVRHGQCTADTSRTWRNSTRGSWEVCRGSGGKITSPTKKCLPELAQQALNPKSLRTSG